MGIFPIFDVGFTGPRGGMTNPQLLEVHMLLGELKNAGAFNAHHGMCIGADEQFHNMAKALQYWTVGHPGVNNYGVPMSRAAMLCDGLFEEKPMLDRNEDIVKVSGVLIATPAETEEQFKGSGTWATIRRARKATKPLVIVWPDGTSLVENIPQIATAGDFRLQLIAGV